MKHAPRWLRGRLVYLLLLAPILLCVLHVYTFGVNVFWADHCDGMLPLFEKWYDGTLRFADFWAQHNEHRHVVPRLVMFVLGLWTKWNTWAELAAIQLIVVGMLAMMLAVFRRQCVSARQLWLMLPLAFLATSLRQSENFLFGWQIAFMLPAAAALGAFFCLHLMNDPQRLKLKFTAAIAAATVASFSAGFGLFAWPAGLGALLLLPLQRRKKFTLAAIWLAVGIAACVAYFCGYSKPSGQPALAFSWEYFATLVGAALFPVARMGRLVGVVILILVAISATLVLWEGKGGRYSFWLAATAFGLLTQLAITLGRSEFGAVQALSPRYATISLFVVTGVYGIVSGLCIQRPSHFLSALWGCLLSLAVVGLVLSTTDARAMGKTWREMKEYQVFVFATSGSQPDQAIAMVPNLQAADIRRGLEFLKQRRWNLFASDVLTARYAIPDASLPTLPVGAWVVLNRPQFQEKRRLIVVSGRVVNDARNDVVGGVFLEIDGVFYPAYYGWERDDVANMEECKDISGCGFTRSFSKEQLGTGRHRFMIRALTKDRTALYTPSGPLDLDIAQ